MKPTIIHSSLMTTAALIALSGCGNSKQTEAEQQRQKWLDSLNDSVALYQKQIETTTAQLSDVQNEVGRMVGDFDYVSNPREVEGYYIYKGWKGRYPLSVTGLVARVSEDERFELIATLSGTHFNQIAVSSDGETVSSDIVPHDQALNYRAGNLDRVCFTGDKADSIGMLIAQHESSAITTAFLEEKRTAGFQLPADQKQMVAATWRLYDMQKKAHLLEKEIPRLSGKISACRRIMDANDSI